jgi:molecular chaperone HscB
MRRSAAALLRTPAGFRMDLTQTHFELFGLPRAYAVDRERLDAAYRELQNAVHPDRFAAGSEGEQRAAMQWATQVNEAYQTLKHPVNRGVYLLRLEGIDALDPGNTRMDPAFLMQQMEWREAIEEARASQRIDVLDALSDELRIAHRHTEARLEACIDAAHDLTGAAETVRQLRFMDKLIAEVGEVYEELES